MRSADLSGRTYGMLFVVRPHKRDKKGRIKWECLCSCGAKVYVNASSLTRRNRPTVSCGCIRKLMTPRTHGKSKTPLYQVWRNMHSRCANPKHPQYPHYGGRGIVVCERWKSFAAFLEDMGPSAFSGLYLDRIDVNGVYEPENCRWVDPRTSSENRRNAIIVELDGVSVNLSVAARKLGLCYTTLFLRYRRGLRGSDIFKAAK